MNFQQVHSSKKPNQAETYVIPQVKQVNSSVPSTKLLQVYPGEVKNRTCLGRAFFLL